MSRFIEPVDAADSIKEIVRSAKGLNLPILCVDFDGVIHAYTSGWQGIDVVADGPVPGAIEFLSEAVHHFKVCIYSSRSCESRGIMAMRHAIREWQIDAGIGVSILSFLAFPSEKPPAFLTIDDRAVCFDGTFPDIPRLLAFQPWNKKEG